MKTGFRDIWVAMFWGMILPGILLNGAVYWKEREKVPPAVPVAIVLRREDGRLEARNLEEYLVEVVLAEMPATFEKEALKAQAVAARTYTRKSGITGGKHGDGSVCTNAGCCQAYITEVDYLNRGGTEENLNKVRQAVEETSGYVLTYGGDLIEAVYFSCSGGRTEDAAAVWGTEYPYLQAVDSPGEEGAAVYWDRVSFSSEEFQEALGIKLVGEPEAWFGLPVYTEGGGVAELEIGGIPYTGPQLRYQLGLRSTAFSVETEDDTITITTRGYGHRVGMSQYGAEAMAVAGSSYEEILAHYYPGTGLGKIDREGNLA